MKDREVLQLTPEEGKTIIWNDNEDFEQISDEITDQGRWSTSHLAVFKRVSDGKFFSTSYSVGSTENCDEQPYEFEELAKFTEVFRVKKTIIAYE